MKYFLKKSVKKILLLSLALVSFFVSQLFVEIPSKVLSKDMATEAVVYFPEVSNFTISTPIPSYSNIYYLSPNGNDQHSGKSESEAWATFDRAWQSLYPGDALFLLDGVYFQSLNPKVRNGEPGKPITVQALNDGKAIIDGQFLRVPVRLQSWSSGSYFSIEGIVARNSSESVFIIEQDNNILRRVSGYNANSDGNHHIYLIVSNNNLLEDCVASGSGRKMIVVFASSNKFGQNNIIRRCFASFREWDGREWHDQWPWGDGIELYNGDHNILENNIVFSHTPTAGFSFLANGPPADNIGNKLLGSIVVNMGRDDEGNIITWGKIRPQPSIYSNIRNIPDPSNRVGVWFGHSDVNIRENFLQDILVWGNAGFGLYVALNPNMVNNQINRATIFNNGMDLTYVDPGTDVLKRDIDQFLISNSDIENILDIDQGDLSSLTGEGARLKHRYIDGVLKDGSDGSPAQNLWPWPMEHRIRAEMGISVTNLIADIIPDQVSRLPDTNIPYLSVSPEILPFGTINIDQSETRVVNLKNTGSASLTLDQYQFGVGDSSFSVTSGGSCPNPPISLAPSESCSLEITFSPLDYKARTDDLYFISDDLVPYPSAPSVYVSGMGFSTSSSVAIPGKVEAEAFTSSDGNFEVSPTTDDGGSGKITRISSGAWLEYPVRIEETGKYQLTARVSSNSNETNVEFQVMLDGVAIAVVHPPNTGGWETFSDVTVSDVSLTQGDHTLRVTFTTGSFDLNYLTFHSISPISQPDLLLRNKNRFFYKNLFR